MMNFSDRHMARHIDGSLIFKTRQDADNEERVAEQLQHAWGCEIRSFGMLSPIDWFAERGGRVTGVLELKCRSHPANQYPTVFLNVRKWLSLLLAASGMGVPALFVVEFTDGVRWVNVNEVPAGNVRMAGGVRAQAGRNDTEPIIEVSVSIMRPVKEGDGNVHRLKVVGGQAGRGADPE